jgi:hypothetical protein
LLARGYADLSRAPERARHAAGRARKLAPKSAAPLVLEARALVELGRDAEAWPVFSRATALDKHALGDPAALHDLALAALAAGAAAESVAAYRALVPRAGLLAEPRRRQRVYLEAAMAVQRSDPSALDESLGYLGEARRLRGLPGLGDVVLGATALTLDRQGRHDEARGVALEARGVLGVVNLASAPGAHRVVRLGPGELSAIAAILAEQLHSEVARKHWRGYLDVSAGAHATWVLHAKKKLEKVGAVGRRPGRAPR